MNQSIITVEGLTKAYQVGAKEEVPDTLMGAMKSVVTAPVRNWRQLRSMDTGGLATATKPNHVAMSEEPRMLWALNDVSFNVDRGDVVGIIGRNGAGKSTLLKVLSRITEPTGGRAVIRGRISSLLEVGTGFHPELTGRENVYMNGTILGMTKREIDCKFDEIVEFSGVEKFLDTPTKRYSSGMQVRLAFAVAAHLEPEILVIDEVLAVGDMEFQTKCLGKMKDVARGGRTVLFVSHNVGAIEQLCSRVLVVDRGTIVCDDDVATGVAEYRERNTIARPQSDRLVPGLGDSTVFQSAAVVDDLGQVCSSVKVGGRLNVRINIHSPDSVLNPTFGIGIDDMLGQRVLSLHSSANAPPMRTLDGPAEVTMTVPVLPLAPGNYVVKLSLDVAGSEIDYVNDAVRFTIDDGDMFQQGRTFHRGMCVAASSWVAAEAA